MGCFWPKYIIIKRVQESYVWWHSRLIQNLKENWLVAPKMTWGIWQIFTKAVESLKIGTLMVSFCLKLKMYELKIYRGVICHGSEEWYKIWKGTDLSVHSRHEEFDEFWPEHLKISEICSLMDCFWPKYKMFELKKVQASYVWWHWRLMQNLKKTWLVLSKMTWRIWQIFIHRLKSSDFISESKMAELNKNKNSKQGDRSDAVWKLYFSLEINEWMNI